MSALRVSSPFPTHALPRLWMWQEQFRDRVNDDFSPTDLPGFVELWSERCAKGPSWAVYLDDRLGGIATFEPWSPMAGVLRTLFKREFWQEANAIPAMRQVLEGIYARGFEKVLMLVYSDAAQAIGLAKKLGGAREGTLRKQTKRRQQMADIAVIGFTREDFERAVSHEVVENDPQNGSGCSGDKEGDNRQDCEGHPENHTGPNPKKQGEVA